MYVDPERQWMTRPDRACAGGDLELFFSPVDEDIKTAKKVCTGCPVLAECRRDTLGEGAGVFGGRSATERKKIREESAKTAGDWPTEKRLFFGGLAFAIFRRHQRWTRVREITGLSATLARELAREWHRHEEARLEARAERLRERYATVSIPRPDWPPRRGTRDAWVWYERIFRDAEINGVTADGSWYSVTIGKGSAKSTLWLAPENVRQYTKKSIPIVEKNAETARRREVSRGWAA